MNVEPACVTQRGFGPFSVALLTPKPTEGKSRFYVGGNIYSDWASVPNRYKVEDPRYPDPSRSTASIFTFRW